MQTETYLLIANIAVWAGVCGYVALLAGRARNLDRRLERLEELRK